MIMEDKQLIDRAKAEECLKIVEQYVNETGVQIMAHFHEYGRTTFEFCGGDNR